MAIRPQPRFRDPYPSLTSSCYIRVQCRWKHLDATGTVGPKEGAVEIGDPERTYTVEPLEDPVPREPSQPPEEAPEQEPLEPERVDAE
jgi:hypothetical protein